MTTSTVDRMRRAANLMVARGLRVQYSSGWENRSRPYSFNPSVGIVDHHTAATTDIDSVLINGRSDLPGPLCNWALHKDGTWVLIAAGYANHAGSSVPGAPSNSSGWGVEATGPIPLDGYGPSAFPNYDSYVVGMACILEIENWAASKAWGHKESCDPPGRKIDPSFSMDAFRDQIETDGHGNGAEDDVAYNQWDDGSKKQLVKDVVNALSVHFQDYLLPYLGASATNSVYNDETVQHGGNFRDIRATKTSVHDEARTTRDSLRAFLASGKGTSAMPGPTPEEVTLVTLKDLIEQALAQR